MSNRLLPIKYIMKHLIFLVSICVCICSCQNRQGQVVDLSGEWSFALDPNDVGDIEQWFNKELSDKISLPGSLQEQNYGNDIDTQTEWTGNIVDNSWFKADEYEKYRKEDNIKIPFWLQIGRAHV